MDVQNHRKYSNNCKVLTVWLANSAMESEIINNLAKIDIHIYSCETSSSIKYPNAIRHHYTFVKKINEQMYGFQLELIMGVPFHHLALDYVCNSLYLYMNLMGQWQFEVRIFEPDIPLLSIDSAFYPYSRFQNEKIMQMSHTFFTFNYRHLLLNPKIVMYPSINKEEDKILDEICQYADQLKIVYARIQDRALIPTTKIVYRQINEHKLHVADYCTFSLRPGPSQQLKDLGYQ
jgi:hypothetical protein